MHRLTGLLADRLEAGGIVVVAEHRPLPLPGGAVLDLGGTVAADPEVRITLELDGDRKVLTVPPSERDGVLRDALGRGWSVLAVEPDR